MGVRLYPLTQDVSKLEKLAGVPAGTHRDLEVLKQACDGNEERYYDLLFAKENAALNRLSSFILFGWGKVRVYRSDCGSVKGLGNIALIREMLDEQEQHWNWQYSNEQLLDLLGEGVSWS